MLVIIFTIIMSFTKSLNRKEILYAAMILTIALLFYSFLHELGHVITTILLGYKKQVFTWQSVFEGQTLFI